MGVEVGCGGRGGDGRGKGEGGEGGRGIGREAEFSPEKGRQILVLWGSASPLPLPPLPPTKE